MLRAGRRTERRLPSTLAWAAIGENLGQSSSLTPTEARRTLSYKTVSAIRFRIGRMMASGSTLHRIVRGTGRCGKSRVRVALRRKLRNKVDLPRPSRPTANTSTIPSTIMTHRKSGAYPSRAGMRPPSIPAFARSTGPRGPCCRAASSLSATKKTQGISVPTVSFYDFSAQGVKHPAVLDKPPFSVAATADGKSMIFDQPGQEEPRHVARKLPVETGSHRLIHFTFPDKYISAT